MLSKCVGGQRVKLAAANRTAATASRTDGGLAVSWRKGEENVNTVSHVRYKLMDLLLLGSHTRLSLSETCSLVKYPPPSI